MTNQEVADSLNAVNRDIQTFTFSGGDLINSIDPTEWAALTSGEKEDIRMLVGAGGMLNASSGTTVRTLILNAFGSGSTTVQNLLDAARESISRAQEIGLGTVHTYHVEQIRS
jgi:hypothetical protein